VRRLRGGLSVEGSASWPLSRLAAGLIDDRAVTRERRAALNALAIATAGCSSRPFSPRGSSSWSGSW
jgi:hypothetical protein